MTNPIQLIVGLGNPGPEYEQTRHNSGCWFVHALADQLNATFRSETKFKGQICQIKINNNNCWLLFPLTYMNCSGEAVVALAKFYKISPETILVVHDELDFPPGTIRIKQNGGHGGHKGLQNITNHLHSNQFYRLRIGIGHPGHKNDVLDYVLGRPTKSEQQQILDAIDKGLEVIPDIISGDIERATRDLHGI
jgi:PTH1 family peptidyl-tRNA hydrolase